MIRTALAIPRTRVKKQMMISKNAGNCVHRDRSGYLMNSGYGSDYLMKWSNHTDRSIHTHFFLRK
jgi:hypothetical protein